MEKIWFSYNNTRLSAEDWSSIMFADYSVSVICVDTALRASYAYKYFLTVRQSYLDDTIIP